MFVRSFATFAAVVAGSVAWGQTASDWQRCRALIGTAERLVCYDALGPAPVQASDGYARLHIDDFKTDAAALSGKRVEVSGLLMPFAGLAMLIREVGDVNPVLVDVERVPREQRRQMMACSNACAVVVRGVGAKAMMQDGIRADALSFK